LLITHGFSGSGKSTYASQLAEQIGAIHLRSDIERKRLFGYSAQATTDSGIDSGIYTQAAGGKTYQRLAELAKSVLEAGFPALVDAAFLKSEQRKLFRGLADEFGAKFHIIDFQASEETLCNRIKQRQHDPSEATIEVLRQQQKTAEPLSKDEQRHVMTVNTETDGVLEQLLAYLNPPNQ
jgi:uncharacterized protein